VYIVINVPAGTYTLTLGGLHLTNNIFTIKNSGASSPIIRGGGHDTDFYINTIATLQGLCRDAYAGFDHPAIVPLVQIETQAFEETRA